LNKETSIKPLSLPVLRSYFPFSRILSLREGVFLERVGTGRGTYYRLTHETLSSIGEKERYTRLKGLSEEQKLQLLKNHIESNGLITNKEARNVCSISRYQAVRLIQKLVCAGAIIQKGSGRDAYYEKC
jgi:ATP-dependent DNA helicase RecG